jgi:hypothetical protein
MHPQLKTLCLHNYLGVNHQTRARAQAKVVVMVQSHAHVHEDPRACKRPKFLVASRHLLALAAPAARPAASTGSMPDAFFASQKPRKRKRTTDSNGGGGGGGGRPAKAARTPNGKARAGGKPPRASGSNGVAAAGPSRKRAREDEELDGADASGDDAGIGAVDDLDLRASDEDAGASGDEDAGETPAEKRLRLARLYLDSVKEGLGACGRLSVRRGTLTLVCVGSGRRVRRGGDRPRNHLGATEAGCYRARGEGAPFYRRKRAYASSLVAHASSPAFFSWITPHRPFSTPAGTICL